MGIAYPQYFLTNDQLELINQIVDKVKRDNFDAKNLPKITHRPLRPEELNTSLTIDTRVYQVIIDNATYEWHMLCATDTAAAAITIPTGSVYLIFGWIMIDKADQLAGGTDANATTFGLEGVGQIKVNGVLRNEVALQVVNKAPNHALLTLDQIVVATEQTTLLVQVKGKDEGEAVIFPLGYRIGPKSQLDVT